VPVEWGTLGLTLVNVLPMSFGGKFIWQPAGSRSDLLEESIPMVIKSGAAIKIFGDKGLTEMDGHELLFAFDYDMHYSSPKPGLFHSGFEWMPTDNLSIRLGIDQAPVKNIINNLTAGVGINHAGFTFDYAYHQYGEISENTTHYFSLGYIGEQVQEKRAKVEVGRPVLQSIEPVTREPIVIPLVKPTPEIKTFTDVPKNYWAREAIEYLATIGIISGYPDKTFKPDESLTRAELSAILVRAKEIEAPEISEDPFPDLSASNWSAKFVKIATDLKLVSGYPDGTFKPGKSLTRAEGVAIISRFAGISPPENVKTRAFPDLPNTHWASSNVWAALEAGMLDFLNGGAFEPNRNLTRGEAAEMLSKTPWGKKRIKELLKS